MDLYPCWPTKLLLVSGYPSENNCFSALDTFSLIDKGGGGIACLLESLVYYFGVMHEEVLRMGIGTY